MQFISLLYLLRWITLSLVTRRLGGGYLFSSEFICVFQLQKHLPPSHYVNVDYLCERVVFVTLVTAIKAHEDVPFAFDFLITS